MLYALFFLPALAAIAYVLLRPRQPRIVEETAVVPAPEAGNPFETLDHLLAELERLTLDERDVEELERLADELERTARELDVVPKQVGSSGPPWRLSAVEAAQSRGDPDEASP